jgi:hypothetical protein
MASIRAKQLKKGALPLLTSEDNKQVVMSLREIAAGLVKAGDADSAADTLDTAEANLAADAGVQTEAVPAEATNEEEVVPAVESDEPTPASEG